MNYTDEPKMAGLASSLSARASTIAPPPNVQRVLMGELSSLLSALSDVYRIQCATCEYLAGPTPNDVQKEPTEPRSVDELIQRLCVLTDRISANAALIRQRIGG